MAMALDPKIWWPLFPLLLLVVIVALSAGLVWAIRRKTSRIDVAMQSLALACYLFTAVVAIASESRGGISPAVHRLPSLLTQAILLAQLVRISLRLDARPLRVLNLIAWGAILADTALHYMMARG
ncbi:MAG: hypothetical protein AUH96_03555 [Nitrospirae bacterium 13_2_20CM_2_61_4]|nr:MAG: hypothetical protein AUH96_03555 [Nitrospirae bacterium 13_2_20CM_2_61_4]